jgi:RND family efflux transporter MFP subunit
MSSSEQFPLRAPGLVVAFTLTLACAAAVLLCVGCSGSEATPAPPEEVRPVHTVVAGMSRGALGSTYAGTVQARHESKLGFQVSGRVTARLVELGSHVKRGQPLMRLDPAQESLRVASADADVEGARHRVAQLRVDVQRTEQLLARQFASQAELDQQRLQLAEAESQLRSAAARRDLQANRRAYTTLLADRDGVVTALNAETGQVVSAGQAVLTVAADGEREVLVSVPESRLDELRRARTLQVSLWARPGTRYAGTLRELAPDADSVSRTYAARIAVQGAGDTLVLGMTATVAAAAADDASALRLPMTAVMDTAGQPQVWVVDDKTSRVALRPVKLGGAQNDAVVVSAGLQAGETVVVAGAHLLHEGQAVKPVPAGGLAVKEAP